MPGCELLPLWYHRWGGGACQGPRAACSGGVSPPGLVAL